MDLIEAFALKEKEIISLVGGGGKTTLMFALSSALSTDGYRVISTTTTKILVPSRIESPKLILLDAEPCFPESLLVEIEKYRHLTIAANKITADKLQGIGPESVLKLDSLSLAPYIIIEADGARHLPLKAPNTTEPVIPENTTLVIPVVGIDALDCKLSDEFVFRAEIASKLLGIPIGSIMSCREIAALITHPQGIAKGSPPGARIVPFINKMDREVDLSRGRELANQILNTPGTRIERVILGQARLAEPVVEVIGR